MKGFIEVTSALSQRKVCINPQHIIEFGTTDKDDITRVLLVGRERTVPVEESYEVLKEMIEEATR